ncbi:MAG: hypothetical protein V4487_07475, partial [Chlamydiota bacterium]
MTQTAAVTATRPSCLTNVQNGYNKAVKWTAGNTLRFVEKLSIEKLNTDPAAPALTTAAKVVQYM